jgi:hypothetical protein
VVEHNCHLFIGGTEQRLIFSPEAVAAVVRLDLGQGWRFKCQRSATRALVTIRAMVSRRTNSQQVLTGRHLGEANQIGQQRISFREVRCVVVVVDTVVVVLYQRSLDKCIRQKLAERDGDCLDCCSDDGGLVLSSVDLFETYLISCSCKNLHCEQQSSSASANLVDARDLDPQVPP